MENTYTLLIKYTECYLFYNEKSCSYIKNRNTKGCIFCSFSFPDKIWYDILGQEERDWWGMQRVWGRGEAYSGFWWGNLRVRDHLGYPGVDGR